MTDLIALGEQVMSALDKRGVQHGYYSVGSYGISLEMMGHGLTWRLEVYPLLDTIRHARFAMPLGWLVSGDFVQWERLSKCDTYPEWAAYLAWYDCLLN